jgi:hypothetical protein
VIEQLVGGVVDGAVLVDEPVVVADDRLVHGVDAAVPAAALVEPEDVARSGAGRNQMRWA